MMSSIAAAGYRRHSRKGVDRRPPIALLVSRLVFAIFMLMIAVYRRPILMLGEPTGAATDIAGSPVVIFNYVLVLIVFGFTVWGGLSRGSHPAFWVAALIGLLLVFFHWPQTTEVWAGIVHLVVAVIAWIVGGAYMWLELRRPDPFGFVVVVVAVVVVIQFGVVSLQSIGVISVGTLEAAGGVTLSRASGTFSHPGNMGKAMFFLVLLALPATASRVMRTRLLGIASILLIVVMIGLSYSRANMIALAATLLVWLMVSPGQNLSRRALTLLLLGLVALPFVDALVARFEYDPEGGLRPLLWDAAMIQLSNDPLLGVGPNSFIAVVGSWDAAVATGYPVHNTFVLILEEAGALFTLAFFFPVLVAWIRAIRSRSLRQRNLGSSVIIASIAGIVIIGWTGWGMAASPYLQYWFMVTGMLVAVMRASSEGTAGELMTREVVTRKNDEHVGLRRR